MENQLEQLAAQTFCLVPEIYQQAFIDAGADFPDELVAQIKEDPEQAVTLLKNDTELQKAVIDIFSSNQEAIMQAAQEKASQQQMFKAGGKLEQGLQMFQAGGQTRRQALDKAERVHGYEKRRDARRAYRNAKKVYREEGLRGRELRGNAREYITRRRPEDIDIEMPAAEIAPILPTGPAKGASIIVGDLVNPSTATVTKTIRIKRTPAPAPAPTPEEPQKGLPGIEKNRRYMHAWNQYQAERHLFDDKNTNLVAGIDPRAYSNFMWKDFNDAYDYDKGQVKSDFYMKSPTQQDLALANEYAKAHKPMDFLPLNWRNEKNWHDNDIDLNERMFYSPTSKNYGADYRADREARPIPESSLYRGIGNTVGPLVMLPAAGILAEGAIDAVAGNGVRGALSQAENAIVDAAKTGRNAIRNNWINQTGVRVSNNPNNNAKLIDLYNKQFASPRDVGFHFQAGGTIKPNTLVYTGPAPDYRKIKENWQKGDTLQAQTKPTPFQQSNNLPVELAPYTAPANTQTMPQAFNTPENIKRLKIKNNKYKMLFKQSGGLLKLDLAQNNFNTK